MIIRKRCKKRMWKRVVAAAIRQGGRHVFECRDRDWRVVVMDCGAWLLKWQHSDCGGGCLRIDGLDLGAVRRRPAQVFDAVSKLYRWRFSGAGNESREGKV